MNIIEIQNVTKTFGDHTAVDNLSLAVPEGSIYGFIGPNGSGKTTTLRMIMRILHPNAGTIRVLGEESYGAAHDRIGYLPEERGLYKKMKVRDILQFYAELKSVRNCREAVQWWLERLDLAEWASKKVETLSKGMAQKVQFIAAVIAQPDLLILDEPFTGLDPVNMDVLRETVLDLRKKGTTVIFSTHDMGVAEKLCDFIFMIYKGRKVLDGTLSAVQGDYGQDTLRIQVNSADRNFANLPGVEHVTDFGHLQELRIRPGTNPQTILALLMQQGEVIHFELAKPSLHDIFIRIASPEKEAVKGHA
ncbi:MAG: ATP-binding cassette domain-containing protein [Pirellulales bacterium]|nr:ATP-binding cassette domain-containing protein [Pirellulales bacterium]